MWVLGLKSKPPPQPYGKDFPLQVIYAITLLRHRLMILLTEVDPLKKKRRKEKRRGEEEEKERKTTTCFENTM